MKPWTKYMFIGIIFGIFDVYYQFLTKGMSNSLTIWFLLTCGIWIIPIIAVILNEMKYSKTKIRPALTCVFVWSMAIFSYYIFISK